MTFGLLSKMNIEMTVKNFFPLCEHISAEIYPGLYCQNHILIVQIPQVPSLADSTDY